MVYLSVSCCFHFYFSFSFQNNILSKGSNLSIHSLLLINLVVANLPSLYASHWVVYCIAIKLLHAPESPNDIDFAERLINFYCRTISEVYDQSLEYYSLHAHLHLPAQVRLHGGLSFSSVMYFILE